MGLKVDYNGKIIATVKEESDFDAAVTLVTRSVSGANVAAEVKQPIYTTALVLNNDFDDSTVVAQAIIENTDAFVPAKAICINGSAVAYSDCDELDKLLQHRLDLYSFKNCEFENRFEENITLEDSYCLKSEILSYTEVCELISSFDVQSSVASCTDQSIPFSTETRNNSSMLRGDSKVVTAGANGTKRITENITYINGVEVSRESVVTEIIKEPVTQVIEVGTAKSLVSAKDKKVAQSSGFIFPLPKRGWTVSAYFGDGRNHRAIDLACDKGTEIYAVKSGTVVSAGYDGNYGLSIVIDHGNGLKTRYAHESEIFVKAGDTVSAGECIGAVGRTGNASGNHLHFEVIINGDRFDPAPYIGLD